MSTNPKNVAALSNDEFLNMVEQVEGDSGNMVVSEFPLIDFKIGESGLYYFMGEFTQKMQAMDADTPTDTRVAQFQTLIEGQPQIVVTPKTLIVSKMDSGELEAGQIYRIKYIGKTPSKKGNLYDNFEIARYTGKIKK